MINKLNYGKVNGDFEELHALKGFKVLAVGNGTIGELEEISDCKASRKNREQCCANHGRKACRSKLSVSESR